MNQPLEDPGLEENPLTRIRTGMDVYEQGGKKIGTVKSVYMGEASPEADKYGRGSAGLSAPPTDPESGFFKAFEDALSGEDNLDQTVRNRLRRSGFIRIDAAGLFSADRYITPDRIASVEGDRVLVNQGNK